MSASVSLQVLEMTEKFSNMAASHSIATDYGKLDCVTAIFMSFFSRNQPLAFWKALLPVFNSIFNLHGATLMARENDRFLKQVTFHLLRLAVFRNDNIRKRAVIGLQFLVRVGSLLPTLYQSMLMICFLETIDFIFLFAVFVLLLYADSKVESHADYHVVRADV